MAQRPAPRFVAAASLAAVLATASASAQTTDTESSTEGTPTDEGGIRLDISVPGEWQVRLAGLSSIPLSPPPGQTGPSSLGQTWYLEQWFRFTPEVVLNDALRLVVQLDLGRGILIDDSSTRQVELSRDARNTELGPFPNGVLDLRWAYVDWLSPIGVVLAGQQGSHWGLGIVANDGNHPPLFGDYRMGDIVERLAFATRPLGKTSDLVVAVAGDLVYRDRLAQVYTSAVPVEAESTVREIAVRTIGGDRAWQGVFSAFYQDAACRTECERKRVGVYAAYRDQTARDASWLRVAVVDLYGRWEGITPGGSGRWFAAAEVAGIFGSTNYVRTEAYPSQTVAQLGGAFELGIERGGQFRAGFARFTLAGGAASGDGNPTDGVQRAFTFNPDYRVGLILFPELLAWQTARSASIAGDPRLVGRPTPGAQLLPSSGGVTNAMYLNPTAIVNLANWLDLRAGVVVAQATSDLVDPVSVVVTGRSLNYRGGDARARDLGIEFDFGAMVRAPLPVPHYSTALQAESEHRGGVARRLAFVGGVQAGLALPGHAFDDGAGRGVGPLWLVQGRAGVTF